jgi:hypothetical protein
MNYPARKYGTPNLRPRTASFLPRKSQRRPSPRYPQQGAVYQTPSNSHALNFGWNIIDRIRTVVNWIIKIVQFILLRIHEQTGAYGCSPSCICVAVTGTTAVIAVGTALSIGIGVGLKNDGESINLTPGGKYTYINVKEF